MRGILMFFRKLKAKKKLYVDRKINTINCIYLGRKLENY